MSAASTWLPETTSGTTTSFVPLTTAFSYPGSCLNLFAQQDGTLIAFGIYLEPVALAYLSCLPDAASSVDLGSNNNSTTLSLGPFTCPVNWQTLVTSTKDRTSTLVTCCPPSYTLHDSICQSTVTSGMTLNYVMDPNAIQQTIVTSEVSTVFANQLEGWIHGDGVSRPLSTTNIPPITTDSSSTTQSGSTTPTNSQSTPVSPHAIINENATSRGLSTKAKAGISTAIAVGVIGLIAIISIFLIYRRRKIHFNTINQVSDKHEPGWKSELEAVSRNELAGDRGAEMPAAQLPGVEMHAEGIPGVQMPSAGGPGGSAREPDVQMPDSDARLIEMPGSDAQLVEMGS